MPIVPERERLEAATWSRAALASETSDDAAVTHRFGPGHPGGHPDMEDPRHQRLHPRRHGPPEEMLETDVSVTMPWIDLRDQLEVSRVDLLGVSFSVGHLVDRRRDGAPASHVLV